MTITINRRRKTKPKKKKVDGRKGRKIPKRPGKVLHSLEDTLKTHHEKTDHDLQEFIEPHPERANNKTHKLTLEQREARLVLLHRMIIRKVPPEEIRGILNISYVFYQNLKKELDQRMRLDVTKMDVPYLIGDSMAFFDEVRSMALTMASSSAVKSPNTKIAAMQAALRAENDKNEFLTKVGVYSAPVVEHIVKTIITSGQFTTVEGQVERAVDAESINQELALRLKAMAQSSATNFTGGIEGATIVSEELPPAEGARA